jgi:hypothetical protein
MLSRCKLPIHSSLLAPIFRLILNFATPVAKSLLYHLVSLIRIIFDLGGMYLQIWGVLTRVFLLLYILSSLMTVESLMMMDADISARSTRLFKGLLDYFHGWLLLMLSNRLGILVGLELVHGNVISVPCGRCLVLDSRLRSFDLWKPWRLNVNILIDILIFVVMTDDINGTLLVHQGSTRDSPIREWVLHYLFGISSRTSFARQW